MTSDNQFHFQSGTGLGETLGTRLGVIQRIILTLEQKHWTGKFVEKVIQRLGLREIKGTFEHPHGVGIASGSVDLPRQPVVCPLGVVHVAALEDPLDVPLQVGQQQRTRNVNHHAVRNRAGWRHLWGGIFHIDRASRVQHHHPRYQVVVVCGQLGCEDPPYGVAHCGGGPLHYLQHKVSQHLCPQVLRVVNERLLASPESNDSRYIHCELFGQI
mmetsp:Transcript_27937/g.38627  ORF Transcript_27937/g.38627 Transcript_27937/m.38627 type:complete len:214 (-) Transcript_27937:1621-2262(-)